jgi:transposase
MLKLPADVKIYLSLEPCDMRRQFDGLAALVRSGMERDPQSGDLYIFRNKRGDLLKILFFDRHGYCMLCKRLMRGSFRVALARAGSLFRRLTAIEELIPVGCEVGWSARQDRKCGVRTRRAVRATRFG